MASTVGDCKEAKAWPSALPPELRAVWAWKEDLGSETGSKGEVPCSFAVLHFGVPVCYLPHAIWRYDADVGSLDFKSTAASEQSWPVHTMKQTHHRSEGNATAEAHPTVLLGPPGAQSAASHSSGVSPPHVQLYRWEI